MEVVPLVNTDVMQHRQAPGAGTAIPVRTLAASRPNGLPEVRITRLGVCGTSFFRRQTPTSVLQRHQELEPQETPYRKRFAAGFSVPTFPFMQAYNEHFAGPLEARLHAMVEEYCARRGLGLRAFGADALGDAEFVPSLARRRSPTLETVDALLAAMDMAPAGPVFDAEVEAFLDVTGTKRSVLGRGATNNPSFVPQLEQGTSPTLRTVGKVRAWMAAHASAAEARAIRRRAGPVPVLFSDAPRQRPRRPSVPRAHSPLNDNVGGHEPGHEDGPLFIDTKAAAALVGLAPATLERYRSTGGGPVFYRLSERIVRYRREDLADWETGRRCT